MQGKVPRPENVADALSLADDGSTYGSFGEFQLVPAYQPIYACAEEGSFKLDALEGLVRIRRDGVDVSPADFFPEIEACDRLFIECMCMALHIRNYRHISPAGKRLFINVDMSAYESTGCLEREMFFMFTQLEKHGLSNDTLVFEILETEVLDISILERVCDIFRSNGYQFALDDFGTRHSNIERYLTTMPDIVKLDRSMHCSFRQTSAQRKLLQSVIETFKNHGSCILAEGVENEDEVLNGMSLGADLFQGYGLALPEKLPAQFREWLQFASPPSRSALRLASG